MTECINEAVNLVAKCRRQNRGDSWNYRCVVRSLRPVAFIVQPADVGTVSESGVPSQQYCSYWHCRN